MDLTANKDQEAYNIALQILQDEVEHRENYLLEPEKRNRKDFTFRHMDLNK